MVERMVQNYSRSLRLRSWATLLGYTLEMGREDGHPFIYVDGIKIPEGDIRSMICTAAFAMGMEQKDLEGK